MRTSLNETKLIEDYLIKRLNKEDSVLFETRLKLDPELEQKIYFQKEAYEVIQAYGRRSFKEEIISIHKKLFSERKYNSFRQSIMNIFFN